MGNSLCTKASATVFPNALISRSEDGQRQTDGTQQGTLRSEHSSYRITQANQDNPGTAESDAGISLCDCSGTALGASAITPLLGTTEQAEEEEPEFLRRMVKPEHQKAAEELRLNGNALFGKGKYAAAVEVGFPHGAHAAYIPMHMCTRMVAMSDKGLDTSQRQMGLCVVSVDVLGVVLLLA